MVVLVQHLVKQFGLPDATEQLSLFRLWLCENFIRQVSQREALFFRHYLNIAKLVFRLRLYLTPSRSSEAFKTARQF